MKRDLELNEAFPEGRTYALLTMIGPNVTSYEDKGLMANTAYCYTIKATWTSPINVLTVAVCAKTSRP